MHCSWRPHLLHPSQALLKRAVAPYQTLVRNNFSSASSSIRCSAAPELTESESSEPDIDTLVELGVFGAVHGTGGELKLQAETDAVEERLSVPGRRWATVLNVRRRQPLRELEIEGLRSTVSKGRDSWLIKLKGVDSIEEAQLLQGHTLLMRPEDRPDLEGDAEFYAQELIGMSVALLSTKAQIGSVRDIYSGTGTHDLLQIDLRRDGDAAGPPGEAQTALIPFVREIVPVVDRDRRELVIDPPEGLLDIRGVIKAASTPPTGKRKRRRRRIATDGSAAPPATVL